MKGCSIHAMHTSIVLCPERCMEDQTYVQVPADDSRNVAAAAWTGFDTADAQVPAPAMPHAVGTIAPQLGPASLEQPCASSPHVFASTSC